MRHANLDWVRNEIAWMHQVIRAQEPEIRMLKRAAVPTASAELLLARMWAKVDDLCQKREVALSATTRERPAADHFSGGLSTHAEISVLDRCIGNELLAASLIDDATEFEDVVAVG